MRARILGLERSTCSYFLLRLCSVGSRIDGIESVRGGWVGRVGDKERYREGREILVWDCRGAASLERRRSVVAP